jgi:hypothetical protein
MQNCRVARFAGTETAYCGLALLLLLLLLLLYLLLTLLHFLQNLLRCTRLGAWREPWRPILRPVLRLCYRLRLFGLRRRFFGIGAAAFVSALAGIVARGGRGGTVRLSAE